MQTPVSSPARASSHSHTSVAAVRVNTHRSTHNHKFSCTHINSLHSQMGWRESSQCWLINSGGRLKPLTQWAAMSFLWFSDKPDMPERSITDLNVQLLNRLPVCLLTHRSGSFMHTHIPTHVFKLNYKFQLACISPSLNKLKYIQLYVVTSFT